MTEQSSTAESASPESIGNGPTFLPPTDIYETKDAVIMLLDMPGADPDSLNVSMEKKTLAIAARSTSSSVPQGYTLVHGEYRGGAYERAFTLSGEVDDQRIEALFKDGVLRLSLPKAMESPARKIAVKSA
jgi:HSP20 family molecular chaperone IbpA